MESLCCNIFINGDNFITSMNTTSWNTHIFILGPSLVVSKSLYVFTTGIPISPIEIEAPHGLDIWLTIQCHGGAARITLPDYIANYTSIQADNSGIWTLVPIPNNATISVTGLGIRFEANESIANAALNTLTYGKGQDNDIIGWATMTFLVTWNFIGQDGKDYQEQTDFSIAILAPTAMTSFSTYSGTVAAICLMGLFLLVCFGCLNKIGVQYMKKHHTLLHRKSFEDFKCEQTRVFNPLWIPCAPIKGGYNNFESTASPLVILKKQIELKHG
ncbi:unnamed protein product [Sphagnum jensenii]|uniref:Uncharacterized protein n=1 Tax=Sphagnum jensenii TaxID=128206 RepID=A0ABP1BCU9_9BRYO